MKLEEGTKTEVRAFEFNDLKRPGKLIYQTPTVKKSDDASDVAAQQKDRRFQFDPLLKDLMSMDEQTETRIQTEVQRRLDVLKEIAEEEARDRGYKEGFTTGKNEAQTIYVEEAKEKLSQLDTLVDQFESSKDEIFKSQERFLNEAVHRIAENVLLRELQSDREFLTRTIHNIIEKIGAREQIKILVRSDILEQVYSILPELEKKYEKLNSIAIEPSDQLGAHDCVVETDWNRVDATLKSQMESFRQILMGEDKS